MAKNSRANSPRSQPTNTTPPPFTPTVVRLPSDEFRISDEQFAELEAAGGVRLSEQHRRNLHTLADIWIGDLHIRRSPRPKQFGDCLDDMEDAFAQVERACQWGRHPKYALMHWAMETSVKGADCLPVRLTAFELEAKTLREMILALKQQLPPDPGRQRPYDDERRIIFLANIFEEAGGKATAYLSEYVETGSMADTPFRRFAHQFYSLLPAHDKRDLGGLDKALRLALKTRRAGLLPSH
jgi:hypothetical protein